MENIFKKENLSNVFERLTNLVVGIVRWVLIVGISYIIFFPILSKLSSSFMSITDIFDQTVMWVPRNFTLKNYKFVFNNMDYPIALRNSFFLALVVSLLQLASCTVIGYGFGRYDFKGKNIIFALVIFTLIVPPQMVMIPLYLNFRYFDLFGLIPDGGLNLLNSYWPFILTAITGTGLKNGLFIYIMTQFFKGMPKSLEEAAYVDGAGPFKTFFKIMLPGAVPAMVVIFLFSFVWQWNDYFFTSIYLKNATVLPTTLASLPYAIEEGLRNSQYTSIITNTGSLMFIAPLLLLYAIMQKYFVESIDRTGIVG